MNIDKIKKIVISEIKTIINEIINELFPLELIEAEYKWYKEDIDKNFKTYNVKSFIDELGLMPMYKKYENNPYRLWIFFHKVLKNKELKHFRKLLGLLSIPAKWKLKKKLGNDLFKYFEELSLTNSVRMLNDFKNALFGDKRICKTYNDKKECASEILYKWMCDDMLNKYFIERYGLYDGKFNPQMSYNNDTKNVVDFINAVINSFNV